MSDRSRENKEAQNAKADQEQIKIAIVALSHAISDPWTMMVESRMKMRIKNFQFQLPGHAVIAKRAVRGARWSEESTGVTVFQLDGHPVDRDDFVTRLIKSTGLFFFVFDDLLHS